MLYPSLYRETVRSERPTDEAAFAISITPELGMGLLIHTNEDAAPTLIAS
jgi:hypothetical protein